MLLNWLSLKNLLQTNEKCKLKLFIDNLISYNLPFGSYICRDENVYNDCLKPVSVPWVARRSAANEMELHITVADVDDSAPVFSQDVFKLAVIRGVAAPYTIIKLAVRIRLAH